MTTTTKNVTLKQLILQMAKRRRNGVTVREAYESINKRFVNDDGTGVRPASVRARTYELEAAGDIKVVFDPRGPVRRNGATVFAAF